MIKIKKAKIRNSQLICSYEETSDQDSYDKIDRENNGAIHPDLQRAFDRLTIHVALIAEQITDVLWTRSNSLLTDDETLDIANYLTIPEDDKLFLKNFTCSGYSIGGYDEHEGVTLIGYRTLNSGKTLNLICPFTKWEDDHNPYDYAYELEQLIRKANDEVIAYLTEGKRAPDPQMEIQFPT